MREMMSPSARDRKEFHKNSKFSKSAPGVGSVLCKWEDKIFSDDDSETARSNASTPVKQQESLEQSIETLQQIEDEMQELKLLMADSETFKNVAELEQSIQNLVSKKQASLAQKLDKVDFEGNDTVDSEIFARLKDKLNNSLTRLTGVRKAALKEVSPVRHEKVEILESQCQIPPKSTKRKKKRPTPTWESRLFNSNEDLEMMSEALPRFSYTPAAADRICASASMPAQIRYGNFPPGVALRPYHHSLPRLKKRQLVGSVQVPNGPPVVQFQIQNAAGIRTKQQEFQVQIIPSSNPRELHDVDDAPSPRLRPIDGVNELSTVHLESVVRDVRLAAKRTGVTACSSWPSRNVLKALALSRY